MDDKQKALFDACMRQADYLAGRWDRRRTDEWKTTIAIWALLVGGIYLRKSWPLLVNIELAAVMLALLFGYVKWWLMPVWKANNWEKQVGRFYRDQADLVMRGADHIAPLKDEWIPPKGKPEPSFWGDWSMWFQVLSVSVLGALFFIFPR
jgi:hypothetical protein